MTETATSSIESCRSRPDPGCSRHGALVGDRRVERHAAPALPAAAGRGAAACRRTRVRRSGGL